MDVLEKIEGTLNEQLEEKEINKLADALYKSHLIAKSKGDNEVSNIARIAIASLRDLQRKRDKKIK